MSFKYRCISLLILLGLGFSSGAFAQGKRVALIIGNAAYASGPLANPVNDATDMAASLKSIGFEVLLGTNANKKTMYQLIEKFGTDIHGADVALFYYSGHGVQVGGENYLIPVAADIEVANDIEVEAVGLERIVGRMNEAGAGTNAIILDACRNNPFPRASRGMEKGLAVVAEKPPESIIVYSTEAGETADDGSGRNGVFTAALLKNITRDEEFTSILRDVNGQVRTETNEKQKPAKYDNLTHVVYLTGKGPAQTSLLVSLATSGTVEVAGKKLQIAAGDTLPLNDLTAGDYVMKVTYDDGKTESRAVTVEGGKAVKVSFAYQRGSLTVSLKTAGTVEVAGKKLQLGAGDTIPVPDLPPGVHVLKVTYDDGKTESRAVTVEGGTSVSVSFEYQRGSLTVSLKTTGTVEVAGKKLQLAAGNTSIVSNLSPGDYLLKVTYEDGKTESGAVTIEGGKRADMSFSYTPPSQAVPVAPPPASSVATSATTGTLSLTSDPAGIKVSIDDGEPVATPVSVALSPGTHNFHLLETEVGGITYPEQPKQLIAIAPGGTLSVPLKPEAAKANLTFHLVPDGYDVLINGAKVGVTPLDKLSVTAGKLDIRFERSGEPPQSMSVDALPNQDAVASWGTSSDLPVQLRRQTIALDRVHSWDGIEPLSQMEAKVSFAGEKEYAIADFYMCRDDKDLFWRVDFNETNPLKHVPARVREVILGEVDMKYDDTSHLQLIATSRGGRTSGIWDNAKGSWSGEGWSQLPFAEDTKLYDSFFVAKIGLDKIAKYCKGIVAVQFQLINGSTMLTSSDSQSTPAVYIDFSK